MKSSLYPVMSLRDIVIFPHMVAPLVVGRTKSIRALEDSMEKRTEILLVAQKDSKVDDPAEDEIYTTGTLAVVMQLLRLPDGTIKALVEGKRKADIVSFVPHDEFLQAEVIERTDIEGDEKETEVFIRRLRVQFESFADAHRKIPREVVKSVKTIVDNGKLVDVISAHLPLQATEKQEILELDSLPKRIEKILSVMHREMELAELEKEINARTKKRMGKTQRNYFLGEKVKVIQNEIGQNEDGVDEIGELEQALEKKKLPKIVRDKASKELKKLRNMPPMSAETTVVRNYIDCILDLPWAKKTRSKIDILKAEKILDEDHFGLEKPKERILEYLAVQAQVKKLQGPIICLVGPPGVGKTSISKSIARAMGRKFTRISLGGVRDEAEIRGHRRTYVGAMPGKIIQAMQKIGVANPVFCLDEVDKMSTDFRGDPSSALLEVLDPEQNDTFNDHYLDLDYDLSDIFFITTANNLEGIPLPLQDRMEIISLNGYTEEEKQKIAEGYLIPKQLEINGFKQDDISLTSAGILEIVRRFTKEAGVRNLERTIASVFRKIARDRLKKRELDKKYKVTAKTVLSILGTPKYRYGLAENRPEVGLVTGLAWTSVGGDLLQIEATLMHGTGKMIVTGKLGDVMQESAQAALSYVRSRSMRLGLKADFYQKLDIHIHVPEGAIPKDGPSAGITMATALVSAILKLPVNHEIAMTGEITLRGRVLPIGGLTEKLLAAKRGNIKTVLIPKENERNLKDVPANIRRSLTIHCVENVDEVLEKTLILKEGEELFKDVPMESIVGDFTVSSHNAPH